MMFLDGYIGAPPTSTVISAKAGDSAVPPNTAKLMAAANAGVRTVNIQFLLQTWCWWILQQARFRREFLIRKQEPECGAGVRSRMPRATSIPKYELANGYEEEHHVRQVEY